MKSLALTITLLSLIVVLGGSASAQTILMNEIWSKGVVGNLDWIELYNGGATSVDISGYLIYDNGGQGGTKPKKAIPAGTILPANGCYVVITDTNTSSTIADGFGLSSSGEKLWLENATGTIIDSVQLVALGGTDTSYARFPDGTANWQKVTPLTRGTINGGLLMNEIWSKGVVGNLDWIEVYNTGATSLDISGYLIYDNGGQGGTKPKKAIPAGTVLPAKAFYVVITDTNTSTSIADGFGLSSSGEKVWLENAGGIIIDSVLFAALGGTDTSYARVPDGSAFWKKATPLTRGASNGGATAVRIGEPVVSTYTLDQNYPNPFNPATTISYTVPANSQVSLKVYSLLGAEVASLVNELQNPGRYIVQFDASRLSSGVYFYTLQAGGFVETRRMMLLK